MIATDAIRMSCDVLSCRTSYIGLGAAFDRMEGQLLKSIQVARDEEYDNFGSLDRFNVDLQTFLTEIGNNSTIVQGAASLIESFVKVCVAGLDSETAWVTLRASNPTNQFDLPRWHCDGYYFEPYEGAPRKIVVTLRGPGTRFALLPKIVHNRAKIFAEGVPGKYCSQAALQEPYAYIVGADCAAIHSEPPIHENRLFMSLVPGSAAQIAELRDRWNAKPTTYC